ncbi:sensor histidine kinase [Cohnella thailandensis]|uniref:Histidine kinase n=1 Tax=Cohnella thailandensis TaxID=557557 RepID=A0A841SWU1_9BACL|nr:histidine kinase [Cohnella thailandensis]MBB6634595.1 histidine kinase [Cohnella thailandensis]MBP1972849.1 sensor histidine kinase YesM [Cohnella thailandensis]
MRTNSIVFKFALQLTIIVAILFAILVLSNVYSLEVVRKNTLDSARNTLSLYQANIRNDLDSFSKDLTEIFENHVDAASEFEQLSEEGRYFRAIQLKKALTAKMSGNDASDGLFIRLPGETLLAQISSRIDSNEKLALIDYIEMREWAPDPNGKVDEWTSLSIHGVHYLFKYMTYSGITFGTLVNADTLLDMVNRGGNDRNRYVLSDRDGFLLTSNQVSTESISSMDELRNEYSGRYLMISEPIAEFGQITNLVAKQSVFSKLKVIQWIIVLLALVSIFVVPLVLRRLARDILKPVLELVKAAKEVEKGQPELQIPAGAHYSMEFTKLFRSLQSMVREITDLKIQSYEEQIERSRAEIKYLQMQIRPHFFLNAISTVTSLTYRNKNEEIRSLIHHLSEHLRYMFKVGLAVVPLEEEIKHAVNYIRMQEIRYPDQIFHMIEVREEAGLALVPQFMVQTFVENIFKHAMFYGEMLSIYIRAGIETREEAPFVKIVIEDNGGGFSSEWLGSFSSGDEPEGGTHIGIANVRRTLQLLYKRDDLMNLSNGDPSGARVELWIPVTKTDE